MVHIDNNKFNILTVTSLRFKQSRLTNNLHHNSRNNNNMGKHKKSRISDNFNNFNYRSNNETFY